MTPIGAITHWPTFPIAAGIDLPRTAGEAQRFVDERNAAERKKREREEREHAARVEEIAALGRRSRAGAGASARISAAQVYTSRRTSDPPTSTPRRLRTFAALARELYHGQRGHDGELIASSTRGGAR